MKVYTIDISLSCCALPLIASYESGATTLIRHGENGMIVRPHDIEGLAQAMELVVADLQLNHRLGQAAYETIKDRTWQRYGDEVLEHYRMRLARPS